MAHGCGSFGVSGVGGWCQAAGWVVALVFLVEVVGPVDVEVVVGGEGAELEDGYFPADLVARNRHRAAAQDPGGAHAVIEDPEGSIRRHIARSVDEISGRMPTPGEARELGLPPGVPVFRVLRTVYDTEGRPLEVQDSVAAADRHNFRYEVEMG
jgi:GntR family transcriptional regulator